MNTLILFLAVTLVVPTQGAHTAGGEVGELRSRAEDYARGVECGHYDLVWELSSKRVQADAGNDCDAFVAHLRAQAAAGLRIEVRYVRAGRDDGWVAFRIAVRTANGAARVAIYESVWIREKEAWVLGTMSGPFDETSYSKLDAT